MTTPARSPQIPRLPPRATSASRDVLDRTAPEDDDGRRPVLPPLPERRRPERKRRQGGAWTAAGSVLGLLAIALYLYGTLRPRTDDLPVWGLLWMPVLAALAWLLVRRAAAAETRFDLGGIMLTGFMLRALGAYARFSAPVDALVYHQVGRGLAVEFRNLNFSVDTGREIPGTGWIRYVSGLTHAFVTDDMFTGFLVFTFLSFVGAYLCYRAFTRAVPDGDHKRYALLAFLWPSLVYWPSSIGKEAWMLFGLGFAAWGISRVVTGRVVPGLAVLSLGLLTLSLVRPHIALMVLIGFGVSLLARPGRQTGPRVAARAASIALLLIGGAIVAGRTAELLNIDSVGTEGVAQAFDQTLTQTEQGGAAFKPAVVRSPLDYPYAFVTVWFRPFPWDGRGGDGAVTQLLSAAENLALVALVLSSWRRLVALPRAMVRIPYVTFAATYCVVFVYAFSVIGNFGILARQRTQGTILLFVLLCSPVLDRAERRPRPSTTGSRVRRLLRRSDPEPAGAPAP